ncbi:nicotianamine synthase family protein [Desulfonema magnum]|uniref:Nicotianamine synthase domain-containing protein n=1 Tax=Desulfonema magnum TaxID=45655 RepID=A0A975BQ03_9BACT|nr:nicotianamine synthase family protein [Desulfonema magnum]QTA89526.1 Nicotianamine synthase domain-containing protein [Desulfonema magnum]
MKKTIWNTIKKEFLDIYEGICPLSDDDILKGPDDVFRPYLERLNYLASTEIDDHTAEEMFQDQDFQRAIKQISRVKRMNGLRIETACARSVLSGTDPWDQLKQFIYYPNYLGLARMEYQGGELGAGDQVVFLGSGPLPLSLISLYKQYHVRGIGIEQSPEIAELSRDLVRILGLSEHIRIIQGNHFSLPIEARGERRGARGERQGARGENCQMIMVGADALPKDEIFAHLAESLPAGSKVSYRIYEKGLRRLLDDQSVFDLPHEFREYARIRPEPPVNNTSVFVVRSEK